MITCRLFTGPVNRRQHWPVDQIGLDCISDSTVQLQSLELTCIYMVFRKIRHPFSFFNILVTENKKGA